MTSHNSLNFRHGLVGSVFRILASRDSGVLIGVAGQGKSRLLTYLQRPDVRQRFLGADASRVLVVNVDCNRAPEVSEWGLYEIMMTSLVEATEAVEVSAALCARLEEFQTEIAAGSTALLALRRLETTVRMLARDHGLRLAIILDEFDAFYRDLPDTALANLRGLRDHVKSFDYGLGYLLVTRDPPERLRDPGEIEGFYELISRNVLVLGPCDKQDALEILDHALQRRGASLTESDKQKIVDLSGGHPSMIDAFAVAVSKGYRLSENGAVPNGVNEECRKLWVGLAYDEQLALARCADRVLDSTDRVVSSLELKGLIVDGRLFSPAFDSYVKVHGFAQTKPLVVDSATHRVSIGTRNIDYLRDREFRVLQLLFQHTGNVVSRDQVMAEAYPGEGESDNDENRLDSLIKRLRAKIEPVPSQPAYLITIPGVGYRLNGKP